MVTIRTLAAGLTAWFALTILVGPAPAETPPIPAAAPVLLVGDPQLDSTQAPAYSARFALGRAPKLSGDHRTGEWPVGAYQETTLEHLEVDGRAVLRRTALVQRPDGEVLATASIDMDAGTLRPLSSRSERGGQVVETAYDWETFTVRQEPAPAQPAEALTLDLPMFEVGAHDVWMAVLPWREGFTARVPAVFAATGTRYWAVPRVVGAETVRLDGDQEADAWVVELDWWGMGSANTAENHSSGGGADGSAGTGGKYWVLKEARPNLPRVVRIRTEVDAETESVVELADQ